MKLNKLITLTLLATSILASSAFADEVSCSNGAEPQCTTGSATPTCPSTGQGPGSIVSSCPMGFKPGCLINGELQTLAPRCIPGR
jgi:hypothetical protein